ncbi:MAG: EF-hand domain-containing protein [Sphingomonas bacterium]|nr:EF-hand domain-containing protein [Sphingomonas bacterium]
MKITLIAALALTAPLTAIATPAFAQETEASAAAKFKKEFAATDTNKDGYWSRAEVNARVARMRDGKGKADQAKIKRLADMWFNTADTNRDGKVSEPEAEKLLKAMFRRYDANGDGKVGGAERAAAKADLRK